MRLILFSKAFSTNIADFFSPLLLQCFCICIWFYICKIL